MMLNMKLMNIFKIKKPIFARCISSFIDVSEEVKWAIQTKKPVVALESTIITHGMPHPINLKTAKNVEKIVRRQGAIPATIAIIEGRIKVGINDHQLEILSHPDSSCIKTSRRDFPYVLFNKLNGGTTVAGTLLVAKAVGIKFFVTGGLGGVHRCVADTLDVSADLIELGKSPVMVVCSGFKSILDIPKSLEYLETQGVCVLSYKCDNFPSFFSSESEMKAAYKVNSSKEAAGLLSTHSSLGLKSGILLAVPIPLEYSIPHNVIELCIQEALKEAKDNDIRGKKVTPFLLSKVKSLTKGKSLDSNVALIENNAMVGSDIAVEYSKNFNDVEIFRPVYKNEKHVVVIGGSVVDTVVSVDTEIELDGRTVNGKMEEFPGGVGRNIADALGKLGPQVSFISAVGKDNNAHTVRDSISHIKGCLDIKESHRTGSFIVLVDNKGESLLYAGCNTIHSSINKNQIEAYKKSIENSSLVVIDANLTVETIEYILSMTTDFNIPCWFEPTDLIKCTRLLDTCLWPRTAIVSPNLKELKALAGHFGVTLDEDYSDRLDNLLSQVSYLVDPLAQKVGAVMVTLGIHGTVMISRGGVDEPFSFKREGSLTARYYPAQHIEHPVNSSGAGDCGVAGFIAGVMNGLKEPECISLSHMASECSLMNKSPVPSKFTLQIIESIKPIKYSVLLNN